MSVRQGLAPVAALLRGRWRQVGGRTQPRALRFLGGQRRLGALGDEFALMLSEHSKDADGKRIGVGHVAADKVHARVAQGKDEARIAGQAVELGNEQRRARGLRQGYGRLELGPLVFLARFHFDKLPEEVGGRGERAYGCPLGVEAEAGLALLLGGDAQVGDVGFHAAEERGGQK